MSKLNNKSKSKGRELEGSEEEKGGSGGVKRAFQDCSNNGKKEKLKKVRETHGTLQTRPTGRPLKSANEQLPPIEDYYAERGVDYGTLRRNCRIKGADGSVKFDFFKLPSGYTPDDLPENRGVFNQSTEEQPVSPAVLLAAGHSRRLVHEPKTTSDFEKMIQKVQQSRQKKATTALLTANSNEANLPASAASPLPPKKTEQFINADTSFPDDSFNDSDLIAASQQVEVAIANTGTWNLQTYPGKRDSNGTVKNPGQSADIQPQFASTPVVVKKLSPNENETPKTHRSRLMPRLRNKSLFEPSPTNLNLMPDVSPIKMDTDNDKEVDELEQAKCKILKLQETPKKCSDAVGDFEDDEYDEIFSQVVIPGDEKKANAPPQPQQIIKESDKPVVNSTFDDSFPPIDQIEQDTLSKLEKMKFQTSSESSSTNSALQDGLNDSSTSKSSLRITPSATPKSGRLGLSRNRSRRRLV